MEFALSAEQLAFQDAARNFARGELAPYAAQWDENCEFPRETIARAVPSINFAGQGALDYALDENLQAALSA